VRLMLPSESNRTLNYSQFLASIETEEYKKESKKPMAPEPQPEEVPHKRVARRKKASHTYRTRASRTEQLEMEFEVTIPEFLKMFGSFVRN
jgi:hypothetical protein